MHSPCSVALSPLPRLQAERCSKEAATVLSSGRALVIKPRSRAPLASLALMPLWSEGDRLDVAPGTKVF